MEFDRTLLTSFYEIRNLHERFKLICVDLKPSNILLGKDGIGNMIIEANKFIVIDNDYDNSLNYTDEDIKKLQ